jgi:CHAT domain-containing protein
VFAGGDRQQALFDARATRSLRLHRRPVVVLAACRSGDMHATAGPGGPRLASAFLSAGASAVVSTLWDIDDAVARELMTRLHFELVGGASAPHALQRAVLPMITRTSVANWAGFEVAGCAQSGFVTRRG